MPDESGHDISTIIQVGTGVAHPSERKPGFPAWLKQRIPSLRGKPQLHPTDVIEELTQVSKPVSQAEYAEVNFKLNEDSLKLIEEAHVHDRPELLTNIVKGKSLQETTAFITRLVEDEEIDIHQRFVLGLKTIDQTLSNRRSTDQGCLNLSQDESTALGDFFTKLRE